MKQGDTLAVPTDLKKALTDAPLALTAWKAVTDVSRRDFITWIEGAKHEVTRKRRIGIAVDKLVRGDKRPCCYAVVPMDFYKALGDNPNAKVAWKNLSAMEKRDFVAWIEEAENKAKKGVRIEKACALLTAGKLRP